MSTVVAFATCTRLGSHPDVDGSVLGPALRRHGIEPVFAAWDGPFAWPDATLCVVKACWDYYLRPDEFVAWAEATALAVPILNDAAVLRWNAHKSYLCRLAAAGVPVAPTLLVTGGPAAAARAWATQPWPDVVLKPAVSVGALRTERFAAGDPAGLAFLAALLATGDALIQPFLPSILDDGETSLVYFDGSFSHAVRKQVVPGGFAAQPHLGGQVDRCTPDAAQLAVAAAALAGTPGGVPPLFARVDLVGWGGSPVVMEVELIEPALFLDLYESAADRMAGCIAARIGRDAARRAAIE
ncbi:hypothetical protein [Actinoplanes sp. NPDC026619]|uniref:ATP-grasp domain-containing protein n=1 Tax=Actinoplanes sp. NPDC026619 TaxID=3155798 RepID=UPI0033C98BCA